MSLGIRLSPALRKTLAKLRKRDSKLFRAVQRKIVQIAQGEKADRYKHLKGNLKDFTRVHIGSYVLVFKVEGETVIFKRLAHHDTAYKR